LELLMNREFTQARLPRPARARGQVTALRGHAEVRLECPL